MSTPLCKCDIIFENRCAGREMQKNYRTVALRTASGVFENECSAVIRNKCEGAHIKGFEVNIIFTDEDRMRDINREQRNIDSSTDVLSFPLNDLEYGNGVISTTNVNEDTGRLMLGDILVCVPVMLRQADEYGHGADRECAFLICHGLLHLLGYDHMNKEDEAQMSEISETVLKRLDYIRTSSVFRSGFITVIGKPNAGKSTIINRLVGEKVAITSPKPQTTRSNLRAVITKNDHQMIFIDTPGIHTPKNRLGQYMVNSAASTFSEVDIIVMVCDATDRSLSDIDSRIIEKLRSERSKPVFLVINKTDAVRKDVILEKIALYSGMYDFKDIIPVSALKNDGIDILYDIILASLKEGPQYFPSGITADTTMRTIASEIIREKILLNTNDEVPHGVGVEIIQYKEPKSEGGIISIQANIYCEKETHKGIIIGKNGEKLKKIGASARRDIERLAGAQVNIKLWVKVKNDWRNSPSMLKELGFQ